MGLLRRYAVFSLTRTFPLRCSPLHLTRQNRRLVSVLGSRFSFRQLGDLTNRRCLCRKRLHRLIHTSVANGLRRLLLVACDSKTKPYDTSRTQQNRSNTRTRQCTFYTLKKERLSHTMPHKNCSELRTPDRSRGFSCAVFCLCPAAPRCDCIVACNGC